MNKDIPVTYTFSLGANMDNDYNLVPNGIYQYNITLNARGNKDTDGRVSYNPDNGIDYTTYEWPRANCYICHPSETDQPAVYKIPIDRIDRFWRDYEHVNTNTLGSDQAWTARVLWSDINLSTGSCTLSVASGIGSRKDDGTSNYFEVSVPKGASSGNVVVGVYKGEVLLWSWHLWITRYSPEEAFRLKQNGVDDGSQPRLLVTGGYVYRLQANAPLLMDRCIGAKDEYAYESGNLSGVMYYQWGRKDPFPGAQAIYAGGTTAGTLDDLFAYKTNAQIEQGGQNVPYSVNNPQHRIVDKPWTQNDQYNTGSSIWMDPRYVENGEKSIFDPSPSGWSVPEKTVNAYSVTITDVAYDIDTRLVNFTVPDFYSYHLPISGYYGSKDNQFVWYEGKSSHGDYAIKYWLINQNNTEIAYNNIISPYDKKIIRTKDAKNWELGNDPSLTSMHPIICTLQQDL